MLTALMCWKNCRFHKISHKCANCAFFEEDGQLKGKCDSCCQIM